MKRSSLGLALLLAGCGASQPTPSVPPRSQRAAQTPAPAAVPPRARYVPSPRAFSLAIGDARGFLGWGVRGLLDSTGKVRFADPEPENVGVRAVEVPARLGGGWLFSGEHVAYAKEFLAPLRVTPLLSAEQDPELGFDFVRVGTDPTAEYLSARTFEPIAAPTSVPANTMHLAALDAQVGLVMLEDYTVRFSNDAGRTWSPTELGDTFVRSIRRGPDALYLYVGSRLLRLEAGGGLRVMPRVAPEPQNGWRDSPLDDAVREGFNVNATQALLPRSELRVVDLDSGWARSLHVESNRNGGACEAVSGVDGGVLRCSDQIISNAIGRPLREREVETNALLARSVRGALLFKGPCAEIRPFEGDQAAEEGPASVCVRHVGGRWDKYTLPAPWADFASWPLVLRPDDSVVGLAFVETGLTLFDIPSGRTVPVQMPPDTPFVSPSGVEALADDRLCAWSDSARSTLIDDRGGVAWQEPTFEVVRWGQAGPRAFALSKDGKAFETQSCGASWAEVLPPPGPWAGAAVEPCQVPEKFTSPSRGNDSLCSFVCSEVGCVVEPFLRIGWELSR